LNINFRLLYWIGKGLVGKRRFQVLFSMAGLAAAVASLIVVLSLSRGFSSSFLKGILDVLSHVTVTSPGDYIYAPSQLCKKIDQIPGVKASAHVIEGQALVESAHAIAGIRVYGCTEAIEGVIGAGRKIIETSGSLMSGSAISDSLMSGSAISDSAISDSAISSGTGVTIGLALAQRLKVKPGDTIKITGPDSHITSGVEKIFRSGMYDYEASFIYMDQESAQKLFDLPDIATSVIVKCKDPDLSFSVSEKIKDLGKGILVTKTWQESNASLVSAFALEKRVLSIMVFFVLFVSAFAALGVMSIIVSERVSDIAYLKAMGFKPFEITGAFVLSGVSIGLCGAFTGGIFGSAAAFILNRMPLDIPRDVYFIPVLQAVIHWPEVIMIMAAAVFFLTLASVIPAWRAGRLDPVKIFRMRE
jgi:lipoprotein-releasing system permease protein